VTGKPVSNYASAQYRGLPNKRTDVHPLATTEWDKAALAANFERWQEAAQKLATKIAKGTK